VSRLFSGSEEDEDLVTAHLDGGDENYDLTAPVAAGTSEGARVHDDDHRRPAASASANNSGGSGSGSGSGSGGGSDGGRLSAASQKAADAYQAARERTAAAYATARERAGTAYETAGRKTSQGIEANPVAAVVGGLAVGAIIAALLPRTEREDELLGTTGRKITDTARDAARAAREAGRQQLDEVGLTKKACSAASTGSPTRRWAWPSPRPAPPPAPSRTRAEGGGPGRSCPARAPPCSHMSKMHLVFGGRVKDPQVSISISTPSTSSASSPIMPARWRPGAATPSARSTTPR
jgi:hypothetical protein